MGNLLFPETVKSTTIEPTNILYLEEDGMMTDIFTFAFHYDSEIQSDCVRTFQEAKDNNRTVQIYWKDNIIYGIGFKDESFRYMSSCLQPTTFGYVYKEKIDV